MTGLDFAVEDGVTVARLAARDGGEIAALRARLAVPDGADAVRVTLNLGTRAIVAGEQVWQRGRVHLLSFNRAGRLLWYWPKDIASVSGDRGYRPVSAVVPVAPDLKLAFLLIYNGASSGVLRVGPPRVEALAERPVFVAMRHVLVLAWSLAGLWIARALVRQAASVARAGLLLGAVLAVLGGTLTPQPAFQTVSAPVQALAVSIGDALFRPRPAVVSAPVSPPGVTPEVTPRDSARPGRAADPGTRPAAGPSGQYAVLAPAAPTVDYPFSFKHLGHFAAFFLLGLAGVAAFPRAPWAGRLACLGLFAVSSESLQWFVVTRGSALSDLAADAAGLALAALSVAAVSWLTAGVRARRRPRAAPGARP